MGTSGDKIVLLDGMGSGSGSAANGLSWRPWRPWRGGVCKVSGGAVLRRWHNQMEWDDM